MSKQAHFMFMEPLQTPFIESNVFLCQPIHNYAELKQRELYGGHQLKFNQFSLKKEAEQETSTTKPLLVISDLYIKQITYLITAVVILLCLWNHRLIKLHFVYGDTVMIHIVKFRLNVKKT